MFSKWLLKLAAKIASADGKDAKLNDLALRASGIEATFTAADGTEYEIIVRPRVQSVETPKNVPIEPGVPGAGGLPLAPASEPTRIAVVGERSAPIGSDAYRTLVEGMQKIERNSGIRASLEKVLRSVYVDGDEKTLPALVNAARAGSYEPLDVFIRARAGPLRETAT